MQIQPIVIGTAGHIDHGKSSLVKALTGVDPDRLKEEKERGLTIDLGYAPLELPDGRTVGIIDVPGHERFVRNMVAGATGIDLVVLVVAADDGVMPQTREHLHIMELLGVSRGLIALNKVDMVDRDMLELALLDVRETVQGTFLEQAPIVPISATKGIGLDELKAALFRMAADAAPRSADGVFRMPVQRVFTARGFGTIVTGVPISGTIDVGATLEVLPGGRSGKVRGLQAYGASVASARAGHRAAINLADVDHSEVARGCVVATPGYFKAVRMVGARLNVLASVARAVADRTQIRLHVGTADPTGELVLLDHKELEPGASGLVQLRLDEDVVCAPGDPFVLRLASPSITLGGGVVLEESKHRLKRFKGFVVDALERAEQSLGEPLELAAAALERAELAPTSSADLARVLKRAPKECAELLDALAADRRAVQLGSSGKWLHAAALERGLERARGAVDAWFAANAHRQVVDVLEIRRQLGWDAALLHFLLEEDARRGRWTLEAGGALRPKGRELALDPPTSSAVERVRAALLEARFQPPFGSELGPKLDLDPKLVQRALELLVDQGRAKRIEKDLFMPVETLEVARAAIARNCEQHGHLEIPTLRDELATTRKFLIPLLEYFDGPGGLTTRLGANRVLRKR